MSAALRALESGVQAVGLEPEYLTIPTLGAHPGAVVITRGRTTLAFADTVDPGKFIFAWWNRSRPPEQPDGFRLIDAGDALPLIHPSAIYEWSDWDGHRDAQTFDRIAAADGSVWASTYDGEADSWSVTNIYGGRRTYTRRTR